MLMTLPWPPPDPNGRSALSPPSYMSICGWMGLDVRAYRVALIDSGVWVRFFRHLQRSTGSVCQLRLSPSPRCPNAQSASLLDSSALRSVALSPWPFPRGGVPDGGGAAPFSRRLARLWRRRPKPGQPASGTPRPKPGCCCLACRSHRCDACCLPTASCLQTVCLF